MKQRVACVGDSLTWGYQGLWSISKYPYPSVLQALLGADFQVVNLGNPGKKMRKGRMTQDSYWDTSEFAELVNSTWDRVVVMLGTNDAKDDADDWHPGCSSMPPAADCPFASDYADFIARLETLGRTPGERPEIFLAIPPPVMSSNAGFNQSIVNSILPQLVMHIAESSQISEAHVLDVYGALGGTAVPQNGCNENTSYISGCAFFCDHDFCDQVHLLDSGYQAIGAYTSSALSRSALSNSSRRLSEDLARVEVQDSAVPLAMGIGVVLILLMLAFLRGLVLRERCRLRAWTRDSWGSKSHTRSPPPVLSRSYSENSDAFQKLCFDLPA